MEENFGAVKIWWIEIVTDQKFTNFLLYTSIVKLYMSVAVSIWQYFKRVPMKLESATDEWDEPLPEPNGSLSKFVPIKLIELVNAEVLRLY